jgi:hypothetical protein
MVVNFRIRKINQGAYNLVRTPILIKKKKKKIASQIAQMNFHACTIGDLTV